MNNMTITEDLIKEIGNAEQVVFEEWLDSIRPSGDADSVASQWGESPHLADHVGEWSGIQSLVPRIRQLESTLREAVEHLDISAIHTGSVLHETMRAALGDQP